MDFGQMKTITHDTNVTPNQGASVGSQGVQTGGKQTRAAAAAAYAGAAHAGVDEPRRAGLEPDGQQGRRLGRRQVGHLRRADRRQAVQRADPDCSVAGNAHHAASGGRGLARARSRSASTSSSARTRPGSTSRTRSPAATPTSTTSAIPGMLHGRVVRPRGQGAYGDGTAPAILSVDKSSIAHIPGAQVVQLRQRVPRRRRAEGVRRDPGCRPAQGASGRPMPPLAGSRQPLEADARARQRRPRTGPDRLQPGQRRHARSRRRRSSCSRATSTTTTGTCRSARRAASPTSRRAARGSSRTRRTRTRPAALVKNVLDKVLADAARR